MKLILGVGALLAGVLGEKHDQKPIIEEVNSRGTTWKAGHNSYFDGMEMEQIRSLMGAIETPEHLKLAEREIEPLEDIPTEFSSAEAWPGCESIKDIRDQSTCGSCWAFGAAEAMSDRICIASGQKLQTRISAEDINSCCGSGCGSGCNGGYPAGAWSYFRNSGVVTGWLYNTTNWCDPYSFPSCDHHVPDSPNPCGQSKPTPACRKSCVSGYPGEWTSDKWHGESVYSVPSNNEKLQTEIMTHGPIEVAFSVYQDFLSYKSGVYQHTTGSYLGGHAVKMVGWGVEDGTPYWLIANSWNPNWGDHGYFKIKRGHNECGIESQGVAGIPHLPTQTTPDIQL